MAKCALQVPYSRATRTSLMNSEMATMIILHFTAPFKVNSNAPSLVYTYTSDPNDTSYFGLMKSISDSSHRALPTRNWNGFVLKQEPHYVDYNNGQPYNVTNTGYRFCKYYNLLV